LKSLSAILGGKALPFQSGGLFRRRGFGHYPSFHTLYMGIRHEIANHGDGATPDVRGTFEVNERYARLDIVVCGGAAFIGKYDDPGICPGEGW
jgi:hypothetical protein